MAFGSQKIVAGIAFCCIFAMVILSSSSAPTSSPDKKMIEKDETIIRHKDIEAAKQEVIPSTNTTGGSSREEIKAKSKPVEGRPKVILKSVPGQLESILSAANRLEKREKTPPADASSHDAPPRDEHFLQDQEDEDEESDEDLPEEDINKRWQKFVNDPRQRTTQEDSEDQQRSEVESKMNSDLLYSPELVEYIARMDEVDRTIEDLVSKGKISPREAAWYREVLDMEYGAPLPSLPPVVDAETQPFVEIPENAYDTDNTYDGDNNYIFQPDSSRDDSTASDDSQPPSPDDRFIPGEVEEEQEEEQEEGSDYDNSREREELLREFLGMMSLRENEQNPAENKIQQLNHPSVPVSLQANAPNDAVEKELESLPVQLKAKNKTPEVKGTEEEEVRNMKPKQDNRTKLISKGQNQLKKNSK